MSHKQISQWRTVGFTFAVTVVLTVAFVWSVLSGKVSSDVERMFGSLCSFAWIATLAIAGKSLGETAAGGKGFKGIARVLMDDEKPGEPKP